MINWRWTGDSNWPTGVMHFILGGRAFAIPMGNFEQANQLALAIDQALIDERRATVERLKNSFTQVADREAA